MTVWTDTLKQRIEAARGKRPVDLLFKNCQIVDVFAGVLQETEVAVFDGQIVGFGERPAREEVDLAGAILCPGLIDGHLHLESSMLHPAEFARAVLPHGTTSVVADPHEIANVAGLPGVQFMLEATEDIGLDVFFMAPSCVPASHLESSGARLDGNDLQSLQQFSRILGLGEVMNFPGVIEGDAEIMDKIQRFCGKVVDGHAPGLSGAGLDAYLSAGIGSDHECIRLAEAKEKLSKGMFIMIREGSQARDLENLAPLVTVRNERRCMLVSDDCHPEELATRGHMDSMVSRAMNLGIEPMMAIRMATRNPAEYFGLRRLGAIAPGCQADMLVLTTLQPFHIDRVYKAGKLVAAAGGCLLEMVVKTAGLPVTMKLSAVRLEDLRIECRGQWLRVIRLIPGSLITGEDIVRVVERNGEAVSDPQNDLLKVAVFERHHGSGRRGLGFVHGFGLRSGALASTVAHDSHNLVVVGADDADMVTAVNSLRELGGGLAVADRGKVIATLPLPLAGLMSTASLQEVVAGNSKVNEAAAALGATVEHPFMALSFLALPVIPRLKITDYGLVDGEQLAQVPLFVDDAPVRE
ncbi:MAG: adenine deaminase [Deltaproteobacteria bacterium]|nr:adenine deaminase [Deltaproteobacteria bacterium]